MDEGTSRRNAGNRLKQGTWWLAAFCVLLLAMVYVPLPYYVTRPGSALELGPMINVEGGAKDRQGAFMLTTVRMGEATPAWYLYAKLSPYADLVPKEYVLSHGETDEEFTKRELMVMKLSQQLAEAVAFREAGYPVRMEKEGVLVMGTIEGMPARGVLQVGDVITHLDGKRISNTQAMLSYLEFKRAGEQVTLTYKREGSEKTATLTLKKLMDESGKETNRAGIGIRQPEDAWRIEVPRKVSISSERIGGPSAGLMMTLEIYDQLRKDINLKAGYRIAGTGTINPDGSIGRIGGVAHKVVAADHEGADFFLAPDDTEEGLSNYEEAVQAAREIGTTMRIVPVKTVKDAIRFLRSLPPKGQAE